MSPSRRKADGSLEQQSKGTTRSVLRFFWVLLPELSERGRRRTAFLTQIKAETLQILKALPATKSNSALFVAEQLSGVWPPPNQSIEGTERQKFRDAIARIIGAGQGSSVTVTLGGGIVVLHSLDKSATVAEYERLIASSDKRFESEYVPRPAIVDEFDRQIGSKLDDLPTDFASRREALRALHTAARKAIAAAFEEVLNKEAASRPQSTYEEKKALARWLNAELREIGLSIREPRSGRPCRIVGNPGGRPGHGRFLLEYLDDTGKRQNPLTSVALPHLELMVDDLSLGIYRSVDGRSR